MEALGSQGEVGSQETCSKGGPGCSTRAELGACLVQGGCSTIAFGSCVHHGAGGSCQHRQPCQDGMTGLHASGSAWAQCPAPPLLIQREQSLCRAPWAARDCCAWWVSLSHARVHGGGTHGCPDPAPVTSASPVGASRSQSVASSPYTPQPPAEPQLKKMEPPSEGKVSGEHWVGEPPGRGAQVQHP